MKLRPKRREEIAEFRRKALIEATVESIALHGYAASTVERITKLAGVSPGLLRHYFKTKDNLFVEAYKYIMTEFRQELEKEFAARGQDPMEQLYGLIDVIFRPPVFRRDRLSSWFGFWHAVQTKPELRAINRRIYNEYRTDLRRLIGKIAEKDGIQIDERRAADQFVALSDGVWLETTVDPNALNADYGKALCLDFINHLFGRPE
jgi:AcrR family transcriptional regulator